MALTELAHKRKTVRDLIRYIGNAPERIEERGIKSSNYSILLGSGASVTSGIRSGQELINTWKQEVYEENNKDSQINLEEYFSPNHAPDWYESNNAYSSLFENRYDLQRHRRIFVEREVANKKPSIGYAYLVKLIENGYFNTVFTTNFDDLLNEAFYRFSKNRPVVCAHDSSISGISVTSTRPKIIKLHGDYLFDDIKTTLRETESLEINMKLKFQEFAKDYGLIVIGYAGNDRSIMDILTYLLQHEDYFKNGIYWCIRKGDKDISQELRKLLWKDRVYFVEIDGFDELFAEMNNVLNNGALPIDDSFLSRAHQDTIIRNLTENKLLNLDNPYLAEDCRKLINHFEDNFANDFVDFIRKQKTDISKENENRRARRRLAFPELTIEEQKELNDLASEAFILHHNESVLQKIQSKNIFDLEDSRFKLELLILEADLKKNMTDEDVQKYYDELIRMDPSNEVYYEIAANRSSDHIQTKEYLSKACEKFMNDYYIINKYILSELDYWEDRIIDESFVQISQDLDQKISKSISIYPHIDNNAYLYRIRFILLAHNENKEKMANELDDICKDMMMKFKYHPNTLNILRLSKSKMLTENLIKESLTFYSNADNEKYIELVYIEMIHWYNYNNDFKNILATFIDFENEYIPSDKYLFIKANILMEHEYLNDALEIFKRLTNNRAAQKSIMTILSYLGEMQELDIYYNNLNNKEEYQELYLNLTDDNESVVSLYKTKNSNKSLTKNEIVSYAYALLKIKKYDSVVSLLKPYYENPKHKDGAIIVNYLYAYLKLGRNSQERINKKINEQILENKFQSYSDFEKFGAACVLGDKNIIITYLNKILQKEPVDKYIVKKWPILEPFLNDLRIQKLLKPSAKSLLDINN